MERWGEKGVDKIDVEPPLALARFDPPGQAMKFIRPPKKNDRSDQPKLGIKKTIENRKVSMQNCQQNQKKYWIELGGITLINVIASYKSFRVVVRHNSKLTPMAHVGVTLGVGWLEDSIVNVQVREAMETFPQELDLGDAGPPLDLRWSQTLFVFVVFLSPLLFAGWAETWLCA